MSPLPSETSTDHALWRVPTVSIQQLLSASCCRVVDLRAPAEFVQDHVPGAVNHHLFDDLERALVGTLYAKASPEEAFTEGRARVIARIETLVAELAHCVGREAPDADLEGWVRRLTAGGLASVTQALAPLPEPNLPDGSLIVHCWRGGLRSSSVTALLRAVGWNDVFVLEGGYKSYRTHVLSALDDWRAPRTITLRGCTGVGKTLLLREIERLRPGWTLDLEGAAGHRSSILGMVGLEPCNQKTFDSRIATRLRAGMPGPMVVEGESRKVGDSIVPKNVWDALQAGAQLNLTASVDRRVQVLIEDYLATDENRAPLRQQLPFIEERLGASKWSGTLTGLLDTGQEKKLVAILLDEYYDPLYKHSEIGREYAGTIDTTDGLPAAARIVDWIES
ncbi:MAG: tRNA 2-selenouridine synthase [Candidatus Paceibacteria bacterium]|jgi:tRNA 2-selenouridine synthase